jgi:WD40 repeat protein
MSADGTMLASAGDTQVTVWEPVKDPALHSFGGLGRGQYAQRLAFSPEGTALSALLATTSDAHAEWGDVETEVTLLKRWSTRTAAELHTVSRHRVNVCGVALSRDGSVLATGGWDGTGVALWDPNSNPGGVNLGSASGVTGAVAFAADDRTLATASTRGGVDLWDLRGRKHLCTLKEDKERVFQVAFSPDSRSLGTMGGYKGGFGFTRQSESDLASFVTIWDVPARTKRLALAPRRASGFSSMAFSPDGQVLATGEAHCREDAIGRLEPDGRQGAEVMLWRISSGAEVAAWSTHNRFVTAMCFGPDGQILATGHSEGAIVLWDVATGIPWATLTGHTGEVRSLAFAGDGGMLASGSLDGVVRLWDLGGANR